MPVQRIEVHEQADVDHLQVDTPSAPVGFHVHIDADSAARRALQ
ncbi:hypothetical protein [Geodermatophilus poikilotrophus]|nr:hypothetical protein [Geodermatophilus poikilotrophus]